MRAVCVFVNVFVDVLLTIIKVDSTIYDPWCYIKRPIVPVEFPFRSQPHKAIARSSMCDRHLVVQAIFLNQPRIAS